MKIDCFLLTWHGTVLCSQPHGHPLYHAPPTLALLNSDAVIVSAETSFTRELALEKPLADGTLSYHSPALGSRVAERSASQRGYHFPKDERYLCALVDEGRVVWDRPHAQTWETFLPLPVEVLRRLLRLRKQDWIDLAEKKQVSGTRIAFRREFDFVIGEMVLNLGLAYPNVSQSDSGSEDDQPSGFTVTRGDSMNAFAPQNKIDRPGKLWLRNAEHEAPSCPPDGQPTELRSQESLYFPPVFADRRDRDYFLHKAIHNRPRLGYGSSVVNIRCAENHRVLLSRSLEGIVFDEKGVKTQYGFLTVSQQLPPEVTKEGDTYYLDRAAFDRAPYLPGDYLIFYNGNLQNYFHWMVEGIVALYILKKVRGTAAKIVLPSAIGQASKLQYLESLKLFGLDSIEMTQRPDPVVQVERAYWLQAGDLLRDLPEHLMVEIQTFISKSLGVTEARKRVYVEREHLRRVDNAEEVRRFLEDRGFVTVRLEGMPIIEQARLFASAEFVIAPHGAGMSNLIFTPASARVIEFIPDTEMRPFFWLISMKLRHEYGMMPCPVKNGSFNGDMLVDVEKLARMFDLLEIA
jgi:hypothetical protein